MPNVSVLVDSGDLCGEGPLWDAQAGCLYWTDLTGLRFHRYQWETGRHDVVHSGLEVNGFALSQDGGFVVTNNSGIWHWNGRDEPLLIAAEADGVKCQMNDCIADPEGRLFAGSVFYDPQGDYRLGHLIRVDNNGEARVVDEGIHMANGLAFSPDLNTLYFADSGARCIYAYHYGRASGDVSRRRVFVRVPNDEGLPDGLTVDAEGFVWSAQWYGGCVVRYDPGGKEERRVSVPAKQVSSIGFGGPDLSVALVTSAARSEPTPIMPAGYDAQNGPFGGQLFRFHAETQGRAEFRARISRPILTAGSRQYWNGIGRRP